MKVMIDTDELEPDAKGEVLRNLAFVDDREEYGYRLKGCYETFDLKPEFSPIDPSTYPFLYNEFSYYESEGILTYAFESPELVVIWSWDGDGTLLIYVKGEKYYYINTECKCSYGWEEIEIAENK